MPFREPHMQSLSRWIHCDLQMNEVMSFRMMPRELGIIPGIIPDRNIHTKFVDMGRTNWASLPLLLVLLATATTTTSALRFQRQHMSVNILNAMPDQPLRLHCKSHDDDLGVKALQPGHWFGWGFEANVLGTTLYSCDFVSGAHSQGFTVFQDIGLWGNKPRPCRQCVWVVRSDGFYRSENGVQEPSTKIYNWN